MVEGPITILFTDLEGSTALRSTLGDAKAQPVLKAHEELIREQVETHGGHEIKSLGDGLMVTFVSTRKAVSCALAIQEAVGQQLHDPDSPPLGVRVGINTGEVFEESQDVLGAAVNAAARIAGVARGGEVLVSDIVRQLCGPVPDIIFHDRGPVKLKGFTENWNLFAVTRSPVPRTAVTLRLQRTPLVGRQEERRGLVQLLDRAAAGRGSFGLIGGELGIGKSRLAAELGLEADRHNFRVLTGRCHETEALLAYAPFVEILESAIKDVSPELLRQALGDSAPEVARLVPQLRRWIPDIPMPLELPPEQERRFLFNSIVDFVQRAASIRPQFLVLDDLHWADESSLLLLEHLAEPLQRMRVVVIGTYRDVDLASNRPFAALLEQLLRRRLVTDVRLRRLPKQETIQMLRMMAAGNDPPADVADVIFGETEGNPFFIEEVFRHLAEEGALLSPDGQWRSDVAPAELDVPRSLRLVLGRRLEHLSDKAHKTLAAAAVIGRDFSYPLLESLNVVEPETLLDAIDEALQTQLISTLPSGEREARFTFAHELVRQALVAEHSLPRRQRLHLLIADSLERLHADRPDDYSADVAQHLVEAGAVADAHRTALSLVHSASRALDATAFREADQQLDHALALHALEGPELAELYYKRGRAQRSLGGWDDALESWNEARLILEQSGDREALGRVCFEIGRQLGWAGQLAEAFPIQMQGLTTLGDSDSIERCLLLASVGLVHCALGERDQGRAMLDEASSMAGHFGDAERGFCNYIDSVQTAGYGDVDDAIRSGRQAYDQLKRVGDLWNAAMALGFVQLALLVSGQFDEVTMLGAELEPLAEELGNFVVLPVAQRSRASLIFWRDGDRKSWTRFVDDHLEACQRAHSIFTPEGYALAGLCNFYGGDVEEALRMFGEGERREITVMIGGNWGYAAMCLAYLGRADEARSRVAERCANLPQPGSAGAGQLAGLARIAETLALLGDDRETAERIYAIFSGVMGGGATIHPDGRLFQAAAGLAATAAGDWAHAETHFQEALSVAERLQLLLEKADVRRFYALMLRRRAGQGDDTHAQKLLVEALELYQKLEMPLHQKIAQDLLAGG